MRAVAFDAMGVLYTTGDDLRALLLPFTAKYGSRASPDEVVAGYRRALVGELSAADFWRSLGMDGDPDQLEAEYLNQYRTAPGITDLLDELVDRSLVLGCISNDLSAWSRKRRSLAGLDRRIPHWTVSSDVGVRKPDARIYREFLASARLEPGEVVFVDDRAENVEAATRLGLVGLLVDFTGQTQGAISSVAALREALTTGHRV